MIDSSNHYKPEIDGLRAIAVLLILFFHAGFEWASGGYVGVDVFFVISGYLITRNISRELKNKKFSFTQFYIRRIKRLFPALFATLIIALLTAYILFSPADLERLGQSIQYAILSVSNFFFWQESGYFNDGSEIKPLLHTWSLGVEEQFYLIWPAIIVGVSLFNKRLALVYFLIIAITVSLWLNSVYLETSASTVFFHLPFRIFEFAIGAMCVFFPNNRNNNKWVSNLLTLAGLLLIGYSGVLFNQNTIFPGLMALIPCLGTALIILSGQSNISQKFLSHQSMVKIGLISYSVYLIHWPLMVFYKYWLFNEIELIQQIGLIVVSLLLGYLMWKYIEKPFRYKDKPVSTAKFYLKFAVLIAAILLLGYWTQYKKGWPERYPQEYFMSSEQRQQNLDRYWQGFNEIIKTQKKDQNQKNIVVLGNSHAVDLIYALIENEAKLNITFFNSWFKCFNFGTAILQQDKKLCDDKRIQHLSNPAWQKADAIYLHDNWSVLDLEDLENRLSEIRQLSEVPIFVFGPKMTYTKTIPSIVLSHMRMASINQFSQQFSESKYLNRVNEEVKKMISKSSITNINYIDVLSIQCGENINSCKIISDKTHEFLYFDKDHLTIHGAKEFGQQIKHQYPELFH